MNVIKKADSLLEISQLKNIISVDYKDIYSSENDVKQILPGFIVVYGNGNYLFLTTADEFFQEYVDKLREVLKEEEGRVVKEGIFGSETVSISPFTKKMLEDSGVEEVNRLYSYYEDKAPYSESLLFEEDKIKALFPIIEYQIKEYMKLLNMTIKDMRLSEGNNGVYYIKAMINNQPVVLPVFIVYQGDKIKVKIGNLMDKCYSLNIGILFKNDGFSIYDSVDEYGLSSFEEYKFRPTGATSERTVELKGKLIDYRKEKLSPATKVPTNLVNLDTQTDISTWYELPWKAYYGISEEDLHLREDGTLENEDGPERIIERRSIYLQDNKENFFVRDKASKFYQKRAPITVNSQQVRLDEMNKTVVGVAQGGGFAIETNFHLGGASGFYKAHLQGNHYYHVSSKSQTSEIARDNLISLGIEDGLVEKVDLLDIKEYVKK